MEQKEISLVLMLSTVSMHSIRVNFNDLGPKKTTLRAQRNHRSPKLTQNEVNCGPLQGGISYLHCFSGSQKRLTMSHFCQRFVDTYTFNPVKWASLRLRRPPVILISLLNRLIPLLPSNVRLGVAHSDVMSRKYTHCLVYIGPWPGINFHPVGVI